MLPPPDWGEPIPFAVRLYEVATGKVLATLRGMNGPLVPLVFSPDGRTLAAADGGSKITLWSLPAFYSERK